MDPALKPLNAIHVQAEANLDQIEGDIRSCQRDQDSLLRKMQKASRRGKKAKLEALSRLHGRMVFIEIQLHKAAASQRALIQDVLTKIARYSALLDGIDNA